MGKIHCIYRIFMRFSGFFTDCLVLELIGKRLIWESHIDVICKDGRGVGVLGCAWLPKNSGSGPTTSDTTGILAMPRLHSNRNRVVDYYLHKRFVTLISHSHPSLARMPFTLVPLIRQKTFSVLSS